MWRIVASGFFLGGGPAVHSRACGRCARGPCDEHLPAKSVADLNGGSGTGCERCAQRGNFLERPECLGGVRHDSCAIRRNVQRTESGTQKVPKSEIPQLVP
jgi:hypothetical protein